MMEKKWLYKIEMNRCYSSLSTNKMKENKTKVKLMLSDSLSLDL